MSIFRAYDIRGIYGKELNDEIAEGIAKAFVNLLNAKKAVVAMDVRLSSPKLKKAVIKGLTSQSCDVIDIGLVPIPLFYYFIVKYKLKAGIYITGSHDPVNYNGLKLCGERAIDLTYDQDMKKIEKMYKKKYSEKKKGKVIKKDISLEYEKQILKKIKIKNKFKIVVDCGNGCWSKLAPKIFKKMGFNVVKLFCKYDGKFPNRNPEPNEKTLKQLKKVVKKVKADLGIAFDADGDRAVFIDEKGRYVHPDFILLLFTRKLLKKNDVLIADIRCTKELENEAKKYKWKLVWNRVGRSFIKQKMIKLKAKLGGEYSGHYYFKENNYFDDGLFASLMLLKILEKEKRPLSYLINELPKYPSLDFRFKCKDEKKFKVVERLKKMFKGYKLILIDGVGVKFKNGFALVRASNTEPKIELRCEAKNNLELLKIKNELMKRLKIAMKL